MHNVMLFLPETMCLLAALVLFALAMLDKSYAVIWRGAVVCGMVALVAALLSINANGEPFGPGIYRIDLFSQLAKIGLAFGVLAVLLLSGRVESLGAWNRLELPMFLFCSTFGMMMLVSATELLTFYVALEFSAYPLYILVALHREPRISIEGAAKYFLQGAISSALTLYGLSLVFGTAHTTYFAALAANLPTLAAQPLFMTGLLLALAGIFFKLAVFPFHYWAPDVYSVAPNQVVTFIATSSKLAALAVLCRLTALVDAHPGRLTDIFLALSVMSMTLGNLAALRQGDLKRLLAYSAIAHAGYALVGLCTFEAIGLTATLFYAFAYMIMGLVCFLVVCIVGQSVDTVSVESMAGLYHRAPALALALLTGLLGLAGVPPTAGFVGKWVLFTAAMSKGHFALVLIAAINSTVALYYYLIVLRSAYLDPPRTEAPLRVHPAVNALALGLVLLIALIGILPGPLLTILGRAVAGL